MTKMRYLAALTVLTLAGMAGGALSNWFFQGVAQAAPDGIVTAREVRVVDEAGRTRLLMSVLQGRPRMIMLDPKGEFRIELGLGTKDEPFIRLRDDGGGNRIHLGLHENGSPRLTMTDAGKAERLYLGLGAQGAPGMILRDDRSKDRVALWQESVEMGLALADPSGRPRAAFTLKNGDQPYLAAYDETGKVTWYEPH